MGNGTRSAEWRPDPTLLAVQVMMSCRSIRDFVLQTNCAVKWERSHKKDDRFSYSGSDFSIDRVASVVTVEDRKLPETGSPEETALLSTVTAAIVAAFSPSFMSAALQAAVKTAAKAEKIAAATAVRAATRAICQTQKQRLHTSGSGPTSRTSWWML
jgi:hypothetical protein